MTRYGGYIVEQVYMLYEILRNISIKMVSLYRDMVYNIGEKGEK